MKVCYDPSGEESTQHFFASMDSVSRHKEYSDPFLKKDFLMFLFNINKRITFFLLWYYFTE